MTVTVLCVLVMALVGNAAGELAPPDKSYKILMLLPISSKSHRNVFMPLAEALADRGHKIVMLTNHPKSSEHPNVHEVYHGLSRMREEENNMFEIKNMDVMKRLQVLAETLPAIAREFYQEPVVKELFERRKEFDLIIVSHRYNEMAYPFLHGMPFITVVPPGINPLQSAVLGNVLNPAYVTNTLIDFPSPMTAWHRFLNALMHIVLFLYWNNLAIVPLIQKEISSQFPELPPLLELERNMSLTLLNSHFSISKPLPLLPSQVEVGAMHCRPADPLPQELDSWITGAGSHGVIYFSLGSFTRSSSMPLHYRDLFVEAFRRLPQRIIWKYEGELEVLSDNVMISSWLPQQDILAHNNVKVFISHGGLLGLQEAIYHTTPLLVIPIYGDQPKNGMFVEDSGLGHMLAWEELTVDILLDTLVDIMSQPKYKENVARASAGLRDQAASPRDRAVFWTEYVIRHRGAPQLRSPAAQLSWVEFLMLDVLGLLLLALLILYVILGRILSFVSRKIFHVDGNKEKED